MRNLTLLSAAALLPGCAMMTAPSGTISREAAMTASRWESVATPADRRRLRDWWPAWREALASARATGYAADVEREGTLLEPMAGLSGAAVPPGDYRCRIVKLGAPGGTLGYVAYPFFRCRIDPAGAITNLTKLTGSQRQSGLILPDTDRRAIFLGTLALGDETRWMDYGADLDRDVAGIVERIGDSRWRIVFPRPAFESIVDVMELMPAD